MSEPEDKNDCQQHNKRVKSKLYYNPKDKAYRKSSWILMVYDFKLAKVINNIHFLSNAIFTGPTTYFINFFLYIGYKIRFYIIEKQSW